MVSIRLARVADAAAVSALTTQLGYDVSTSEVAERLSRILARPDQQFLIAELDGRPIGWVHTAIWEYIESGSFVIIGGLVVEKGHRRRGIGRMLMDRAEEWARQQGCSLVRLWSTSTRTESHKFYADLGYTLVKTQYSFIKPLDAASREDLRKFVPRVDP